MNNTNHLLRTACTVFAAALMAGCSAYLAARAPGFMPSWAAGYFAAFASSAVVQLGRPERLALGAATGTPAAAMIALVTAWSGQRQGSGFTGKNSTSG